MTIFTSGAAWATRFTAEMPSIPGRRTSMITTSGLQPDHGLHDLLARFDAADELEIVRLAEHEVESLPHRRMVVRREAPRECGHLATAYCGGVAAAIGKPTYDAPAPRRERTCSHLWS